MDTVRQSLDTYTTALYEPDDVVELEAYRGFGYVNRYCLAAREIPGMAPEFVKLNRQRLQINVGITTRRADDVTKFGVARFALADIDNVSVDEARQRIERAGLPLPTLFNSSGHGAHAYWRFHEPVEDVIVWATLQRHLAMTLRADGNARSRFFIRLPGLLNMNRKRGGPVVRSQIIDADPARRYSFAELRGIIPVHDTPRWRTIDSAARFSEPTRDTSKASIFNRGATSCEG